MRCSSRSFQGLGANLQTHMSEGHTTCNCYKEQINKIMSQLLDVNDVKVHRLELHLHCTQYYMYREGMKTCGSPGHKKQRETDTITRSIASLCTLLPLLVENTLWHHNHIKILGLFLFLCQTNSKSWYLPIQYIHTFIHSFIF